jgi:hypothetical protein
MYVCTCRCFRKRAFSRLALLIRQYEIYMQVAPSNERGSTGGSEIIRLHTLRVLNSIAQHLPEEKMSGQCMEIYAYLLGVHGGFEAPELLVVVLQGVCLMARRGDADTRLLPRMLSKYRYPLV